MLFYLLREIFIYFSEKYAKHVKPLRKQRQKRKETDMPIGVGENCPSKRAKHA